MKCFLLIGEPTGDGRHENEQGIQTQAAEKPRGKLMEEVMTTEQVLQVEGRERTQSRTPGAT